MPLKILIGYKGVINMSTPGRRKALKEMSGDGLKNDLHEGKPNLALLPMDVLGKVARAYEYGLKKYRRNSWRKGFKTDRMIAAALRHISQWNDRGQEYDKDAYDSEGMRVHHIAMAVFNLLCVMHTIDKWPDKVNNFIPTDFEPDAPLNYDEEKRINSLKNYWRQNG
jgi:hypothetical protein